jgi:hypothetical protein
MKSLVTRWKRAALAILVCSFASAVTALPETLREALLAKNLPIAGAKITGLDEKITSGAELDDATQFVIAYYVDDGSGALGAPMHVKRFDRKTADWKSAALGDASAKSEDIDVPCLGSVLRISALGSRLLLETHINPSAGCLLVLSQNLELQASLYGWSLGRMGEDQVIYHRSEIHFAPVHAAEIAIYDFRTKSDVTLFPRKPDGAIRLARIAQLKEFYRGREEWCNKWNDPCDPESFDTSVEGDVVTNEGTHGVAFEISYEQIQFYPEGEQKPSGPQHVVYLYRHVDDEKKMECREMLWSEVKARVGDLPLAKLVESSALEEIFEAQPKSERR